jgi:hypothetical protein
MSRIDSYLDGGIEPTELTPEERAEAARIEALIDATRGYVSARPEPDLTAGVMHRIEQSGMSPAASPARLALRRLAIGLWTARSISFRVRPAYALIAAGAVLWLVSAWPDRALAPARAPAASAAAPRVFVQFRLEAATASDVRLAGSFTNWEPTHALHQAGPGLWTVTIPLPVGVHEYAFVVDGRQWVADPFAPQVDDGFGGTSSLLAIMVAGGPQT